MSEEKYQGLIVPLLLPLTSKGEIDEESLKRQIDFLVQGGADGVWVNGTSGDFFALTAEERARVVEVAARRTPDHVVVIAQCGDTSTPKAIRHALRAMDAGADAVAVVPPYYVDYSQDELRSHYTAVSEAVRSPVFLYQLPQMAKVALDLPSILELSRRGVLIGIKDSTANIESYQRLLRRVSETGSSLRCFSGASSLLGPALFAGGHGIMCAVANLAPGLCKGAWVAAEQGRWNEVRKASERVVELVEALRLPDRTNWAPTVAAYKHVLFRLGVIASEQVIAPLKPLTHDERNLLDQKAVPLVRNLVTQHEHSSISE